MPWLINEIIGFVSRAEETQHYRARAAAERAKAAKAGDEDRASHIEAAQEYAEQAKEAAWLGTKADDL